MKRTWLLALWLGLSTAIAQPSPTPMAQGLAFARMLEGGSTDDAATRFHYPENQSPAERAKDIDGVARFLHNLTLAAGTLKVQPYRQLRGNFVTVGAGGGDVRYWAAHHEFDSAISDNLVFDSRNFGAFVLTVNFIEVDKRWEIKSVVVNIPSERPDATKIARQLVQRLLPFPASAAVDVLLSAPPAPASSPSP